jgi:putative phosphonate metabolism protein
LSEGPRYALYWAPERESALHRLGSGWLGRDALAGQAVAPPALPGLDPDHWRELTEDARGYGFHATLKPPFFLAHGMAEGDLLQAATDFALTRRPFAMPALQLAAIGGFLALVPAARSAALHGLADATVRALDHFRRPPSATELARRRRATLTPRQAVLLARWGYPYVLEEFRFHLTLTRRLPAAERATIMGLLAPLVSPALAEPVMVEALWIFQQPMAGAPFHALRRCPFGP